MVASAWRSQALAAICGFFFAAVLVLTAVGTARAEQAAGMIRQLGDETLAVLDDTAAPKAEQISKMRSVFRRYFAVEDIGRFVLGRHWRQATPEQRQEYLQLFEDLIVYGYARRFGGYAGERLEIGGSRAADDGSTIVSSRVVSPDGQRSIAVDWRVETIGGRSQIVDVVVEGVSLKLTQRSDFSAAIKQQGGGVDDLIALLRDKTATLRKELEG